MLCRIDARALRDVPLSGPLIIIMNHINFLEVPLLYVYLQPRDVVGIIKRETWDNPLLGALADSWKAIAIDRAGPDLSAMRQALLVLERGGILILAPEGRRSGDGRLQEGHSGVVQLALRSGATIMPVVHFGGEKFWTNIKSWRRTRFFIKVGPAFKLKPPPENDASSKRHDEDCREDRTKSVANSVANSVAKSVAKSVRSDMTEYIMNRMSILLPEHMRGAYPEPQKAIETYAYLVEEA